MGNTERISKILTDKGFRVVKGIPNAVSVTEYAPALELLKDISRTQIPVKLYLTRTIHVQNQWHDENLTQVQAFLFSEQIGLGACKHLALEVFQAYYGRKPSVHLKSEYIESVVPGIEILVEERQAAGGGYIRTNIMEEAGLHGFCAVVITFIAERF